MAVWSQSTCCTLVAFEFRILRQWLALLILSGGLEVVMEISKPMRIANTQRATCDRALSEEWHERWEDGPYVCRLYELTKELTCLNTAQQEDLLYWFTLNSKQERTMHTTCVNQASALLVKKNMDHEISMRLRWGSTPSLYVTLMPPLSWPVSKGPIDALTRRATC
jgi:hypothetical protein